jgi:hypothetical protein
VSTIFYFLILFPNISTQSFEEFISSLSNMISSCIFGDDTRTYMPTFLCFHFQTIPFISSDFSFMTYVFPPVRLAHYINTYLNTVHSIKLQPIMTFFVHSKDVRVGLYCIIMARKGFVSGHFEEEMHQINIYLRSTWSGHLVIPALFLIPIRNRRKFGVSSLVARRPKPTFYSE